MEAERRSRLAREEDLDAQKRILEEEQKKKFEALAASRRAEFDIKVRQKEEIER